MTKVMLMAHALGLTGIGKQFMCILRGVRQGDQLSPVLFNTLVDRALPGSRDIHTGLVLDSPAVDPRSNPGSGSALLMSEKSQAVYYISSCHMLIDKALSSDKPNGRWFEADWLHCKRDALSSNRRVDGSRLTGSTQACHS